MTGIVGTYKTTYNTSYTRNTPFTKNITLSRFRHAGLLIPSWEQDVGPQQQAFQYVPVLPAPPTEPHPVTGTRRPRRPDKVIPTKFGPMDMDTIERLYNEIRYKTFAQAAAKEFALPMYKPEPPKTTKEPKADMVRLYGQRYEQRSEDWQDAVLWDRAQTRDTIVPRPPAATREKMLGRRQKTNPLSPGREQKIRDLVRTDKLAGVFDRKCPGYGGYIPLCPPETALDDKSRPEMMTSVMDASYGELPSNCYRPPQPYNRSGVLSKTVTLTYPYNPFNKVGEEIDGGKVSRYSSMRDFAGLNFPWNKL